MSEPTPSDEEVAHAYACAEAGSEKAIKILARLSRSRTQG